MITCDHHWIMITWFSDTRHQFVCGKCGDRKEGETVGKPMSLADEFRDGAAGYLDDLRNGLARFRRG